MDTVALPIEQQVNGVENMLYMTSSSTSDGRVQVTVTFQPGTDLDTAQVLVQNRVALAEPRLPAQVRQVGVVVNKESTGFLMLASLTSDDPGIDSDYLGNMAQSTIRDRLLRIDGVGGVQVFGGGNYSMRIWIDPAKAAARDLTAPEIVAALQAQNVQAAGGSIGQPPLPDQRRRLRAAGSGRRPSVGPGRIRQGRAQDRRPGPRDPRQRHRPHRARLGNLRRRRLLQRSARRRHRRHPAAGFQRPVDRRGGHRRAGRHQGRLPARREVRHPL
jgi:hypothetical protein